MDALDKNLKVEKCYNVDSDNTYFLLDGDGELVARFYNESVFGFVKASDELAVLRARVVLLRQLLFQINNINDIANLNDAELWNVNGEFQKIIDAALNT